MADWLKRNLVLVSGIVLPVLLVAGFMVLQGAPRLLADPPGYDFLVAGYSYDAGPVRAFEVSFEVREQRLVGRVAPLAEGAGGVHRQPARLFRYSVADHSFSEITYELPAGLDELASAITFDIPKTAGLRVDTASRSPDGFLFEFAGYRGRGGLLGEMFGMGRYDSQHVLSRDGAQFEVPNPGGSRDYYGQELQFLGWVIGEDGVP